MKMGEALRLIRRNEEAEPGFMVRFEKIENGILEIDHFPDKHDGEDLIETTGKAWNLAARFAKASKDYVNIYVVDSSFAPVPEFNEQMLNKY